MIADIILLILKPEYTGILILLLGLFLMYDIGYALIIYYEEIFCKWEIYFLYKMQSRYKNVVIIATNYFIIVVTIATKTNFILKWK